MSPRGFSWGVIPCVWDTQTEQGCCPFSKASQGCEKAFGRSEMIVDQLRTMNFGMETATKATNWKVGWAKVWAGPEVFDGVLVQGVRKHLIFFNISMWADLLRTCSGSAIYLTNGNSLEACLTICCLLTVPARKEMPQAGSTQSTIKQHLFDIHQYWGRLSIGSHSSIDWRARYKSWRRLSQREKPGGACWQDPPWERTSGTRHPCLNRVSCNPDDWRHMSCEYSYSGKGSVICA